MKPLTESELEILKEAEDILFTHVDYIINSVFDKAFCELHKALKKYKKAIENYVKSDKETLNNLYNEKDDE